MGGPASGRWGYDLKTTTVKACPTLDLRALVRDGVIADVSVSGELAWRDTRLGERRAWVG